MNTQLSNAEVQLFRATMAGRLGLTFDDSKLTLLSEVLARRAAARQLSAPAYLAQLEPEHGAFSELGALASELTVGETYFFRHGEQFQALAERALPERQAARAKLGQLRLLSAGCASGEEAYSFAILARERGFERGLELHIDALDMNPEALAKAARGRYSPWALRETPEAIRRRWFVQEGRDFKLLPELRAAVHFFQHNLAHPSPAVLLPNTYDVIFCRNVLMYFTPERAAASVAALTRALAPGGFLFLGHAETLRGLSQDFHLRNTHGAFYYQRKHELSGNATGADESASWAALQPHSSPSNGWVGNWLGAVERSSERIRALSATHPSAPAPTLAHARVRPSAIDLTHPLALLKSERFTEALGAMQRLPQGSEAEPSSVLLRAALLTHQGELGLAEAACNELLALDELNAGAHYLLALCFERQGKLSAAVDHDQIAAYLDTGFAMPHLHLGLMAQRRREPDVARRELAQALLLLEREDAARLLLFGGGFDRSALLAVCRSQLERLKGRP